MKQSVLIRTVFFIICLFTAVFCTPMFIDEAKDFRNLLVTVSYSEGHVPGVYLKWQLSDLWKVAYYTISRGDTENTLHVFVNKVFQTEWCDNTANFNYSYFYRIDAYDRLGRFVARSKIISVNRPYDPIDKVKSPVCLEQGEASSEDGILCRWSGVPGTLFRLYRSNEIKGLYTLVTETPNFHYEDMGLNTSQHYYYKVNSVGIDPQGDEIELSCLNILHASCLSPPQNFKEEIVTDPSSVKLVWDSSPDVTHYAVYRRSGSGEVCLSDKILDTVFIDYPDISKEEVLTFSYYVKSCFKDKMSYESNHVEKSFYTKDTLSSLNNVSLELVDKQTEIQAILKFNVTSTACLYAITSKYDDSTITDHYRDYKGILGENSLSFSLNRDQFYKYGLVYFKIQPYLDLANNTVAKGSTVEITADIVPQLIFNHKIDSIEDYEIDDNVTTSLLNVKIISKSIKTFLQNKELVQVVGEMTTGGHLSKVVTVALDWYSQTGGWDQNLGKVSIIRMVNDQNPTSIVDKNVHNNSIKDKVILASLPAQIGYKVSICDGKISTTTKHVSFTVTDTVLPAPKNLKVQSFSNIFENTKKTFQYLDNKNVWQDFNSQDITLVWDPVKDANRYIVTVETDEGVKQTNTQTTVDQPKISLNTSSIFPIIPSTQKRISKVTIFVCALSAKNTRGMTAKLIFTRNIKGKDE